MAPDDIRTLTRKVPFEPLRVHMSNGMQVEVRHPDQILVGDESMMIAEFDREKQKNVIRHYSVINVNVIEPLPLEPATEPNGQSKS